MKLLALKKLFLYLWIFLRHFTHSVQIHDMMTDEEYKGTFGRSRNIVPNYEVIQISHSINTREIKNDNFMSFYAFGEFVQLKLQPVAHTMIPVWLSYGVKIHNGHNITYEVLYEELDPFIMSDALDFYEDTNAMAAIVVETDKDGNLHFAGTLQEIFTIRPISSALIREWLNEQINPLVHENSEFSKVPNYHIIMKNNEAPRHLVNTVKRSAQNEKPMEISPRVLIFTHYSEKFSFDLEVRFYRLLIYLVAFWHSVNLRYRKIPNPSITFRIAGIVVGMNEKAAPFFAHNMAARGIGIYDERALKEFGRWIQDNSPTSRESWDIAVILTDWGLCGARNCKSPDSGGVSWIGAECHITDPYIYMVAIIHDDLAFKGIHGAVHELGHILGAPHDGERGAKSCAHDKKIMTSHGSKSTNRLEWSSCSIEAISRHIKKTYPYCWANITRNNPDLIGAEIYEILPGHLIPATDQCRQRGWNLLCEIDENTCYNLRCQMFDIFGSDKFSRCYDTGIPLDGTDCGNGKQCKAGRCVY